MTATSTTYYLLRNKGSAVGDGAYLGTDVNGKPGKVSHNTQASRFDTLQAAEQQMADLESSLGEFEIEVRNSIEPPALSS